jgi:large subunit ribosomal protein L29
MKNSFKELTISELKTKREEFKKDFRKERFDKVLGHIDNPLRVRTFRKQIARINTIIKEVELGIRKEKIDKE